MSDYELHHGDCLKVLPTIAPASVAMVFADLPYGATANEWDVLLCLENLWAEITRCGARMCVFVFTANMRFAAQLIASRPNFFRHDIVWNKLRGSSFATAKKAPMRSHEHVLVFGRTAVYNPQMTSGHDVVKVRSGPSKSTNWSVQPKCKGSTTFRYPLSVQAFKRDDMRGKNGHPTQKPVALLEWLIATYTNPGDTVLDPCFGSNTTGVACARLGRNYIGIEKDAEYFRIGKARLEAEHARLAAEPEQKALAI